MNLLHNEADYRGSIAGEPARADCPACASGATFSLLRLDDVPVYCNVLWPDAVSARSAPSATLDLAHCRDCGHIFNVAFDPGRLHYAQDYENSLHFSPHFRLFTETLAAELIGRHDLHGKLIVDIGCGKGDFLATLCELGPNRGIGFDKSYASEAATHRKDLDLTFVRDFYSPQHAGLDADFVCCRQVLEHIAEPGPFLEDMRWALKRSDEAALFIEVPNADYTIRDLGIWDLIYEHVSYFTPSSLSAVMRRSGYHVTRMSRLYSGQYIGVEACRRIAADEAASDIAAADVAVFRRRFSDKITYWRKQVERFSASGERVVLWGGGSKGATFLNVLQAHDIRFVVDVNPRKHGRFVPGVGAEIVPPEFLTLEPPDRVIVMNPVYRDEIGRALAALDLHPTLTTA